MKAIAKVTGLTFWKVKAIVTGFLKTGHLSKVT
jgi:hypothetical protein